MNSAEAAMKLEAPLNESIWSVRPFWLTLLASLTVQIGSQFYRIALPIVILAAGEKVFVVNAVGAISYIPNLILAFAIGALVDCVSRRALLVVSAGIQAAAMVLLWGAFYVHGSHLYIILSLVFVISLFSYVYQTGQGVVVKLIMPEKTIQPAVATLSVISTVVVIAGPSLSGLVLMFSDMRFGLLLGCLMLSITVLVVLPLRLPALKARLSKEVFAGNLKAGWLEFSQNRRLRYLTLCVMISNMAIGIFETEIFILMRATLHLNASTIGTILSVSGIGAVLGGLSVTALRKQMGLGYVLAMGAIGSGIAFALVGLVRGSIPILYCSVFFESLFVTIFSVSVWSFRQESTSAERIGAVSGLTGSFFKVGMPIAILGAGWLVNYTSIYAAFWTAGALSAVYAVMILGSPLLRSER